MHWNKGNMHLTHKFKGVKVLVAGDVMLDRYWWGNVSRISPEAPVPVVRMSSSTAAAGGAANVAANIAGLGAVPYLLGVIGDDEEGRRLPEVLTAVNVRAEHLITSPYRPTTVKTRVIAHGQQVARVDKESNETLSESDQGKACAIVERLISECDVVVISDYAKGFLTDPLLSLTIEICRRTGKPVLVDPKGRDYAKYAGATLLTPNRQEAITASGLEENSLDVVVAAGRQLLGDLSLDALLVTQGEDGMTLFQATGSEHHLHTRARNVYDVTGAGDTVIATMAVAIGAGMDFADAADVANKAAGLVVEKVGTTAITSDMLRNAASD